MCHSKLLILDEGPSAVCTYPLPADLVVDAVWCVIAIATSAIDRQTDAVIQTSLRNDLGGDVTVIIIAHRLQKR